MSKLLDIHPRHNWAWIAVAGLIFILSMTWGYRGALPTWGDETFTLRLSQESWAEFWDEIKLDVHPPLYFALSKIAALRAAESVRAPAEVRALAYVIYLCLLWFTIRLLQRRLERSRQAAFPILLILSSACLALFGPMMRYYSLATLGVTCATLLLLPEHPDRKATERKAMFHRATWYGITLWTAFASSYLTIVVLPAHMVFLAMRPRRESRPFWLAMGITALFSLPLLWLVAVQPASRQLAIPGLEALLIGAFARLAFTVYSFLVGENVRPWDLWFSVPAIAAFCLLVVLSWHARRTHVGGLLMLLLLTGLPLGALALAWASVGIEFSASRLVFLAPAFLVLLGLGPAIPGHGRGWSGFGTLSVTLLVIVNLVSTYHYAQGANALQSTYVIPWERIAKDISEESTESTLLLHDDDTLPYWLPAETQMAAVLNINTVSRPEELAGLYQFDRVILVYSPRDITCGEALQRTSLWLDTQFDLALGVQYLVEDETSLGFKSILLRRPVEPVKKAVRVYEAVR